MPILAHSTTTVVAAYLEANQYHLATSTIQGQKAVFKLLARRTAPKRFAHEVGRPYDRVTSRSLM